MITPSESRTVYINSTNKTTDKFDTHNITNENVDTFREFELNKEN